MRQRLSASDVFHRVVDQLVRRAGGVGNISQLRVRLRRPLADATVADLARAWTAAGREAWILGARTGAGLRGAFWCTHGPARLALAQSDLGLTTLADTHLADGLDARRGELVRLGHACAPDDPGVVLTWNHRLADARGMQGLLAALPRLARGERLGQRWWESAYRSDAEMPADAAGRGRSARAVVAVLRPLRTRGMLRATGGLGNAAVPLRQARIALGEADTARCDARQRAATGRFSENPFLLACVAAALETCCGVSGDLLFPFAADQRQLPDERLLANHHGFLMLGLAAGLATADLGEAGRALKAAHRTWVGSGATGKLLSAISWFPWTGGWFARFQLGFGRSGLAASCLVSNAGRTLLPERWFGGEVQGVDHAVALPGNPGLAVLFHRDGRGLGFDVLVAGRLGERLPPECFAQAVRHQLLERPFPGAP